MVKRSTMTTAIVTATGVAALYGAALAQVGSTGRGPSQSDFDTCNREAQVVSGGSPSTGGSASPGGVSPSVGGGAPGGLAPGGGTATGPGSAMGATGGAGSVSGGSTLSSGSSSVTGDTTLRGISPSAQADPGFQQAYRDCLRRRGF